MVKKKRDLLLICNQFPFFFGETFLEVEFSYLYNTFDKIFILSRNNSKEQTRKLPHDVTLIQKSTRSDFFENVHTLLFIIMELNTFYDLLKSELSLLSGAGSCKRKFGMLKRMLHDAFKAFEIKRFIKNQILQNLDINAVLYSYWQNSAAVALALIKKEMPAYQVICRSHGVDLYMYRNKLNYLSYRQFISKYSDNIFFISDDGKEYQTNILEKDYKSFFISKLGTSRLEINKGDQENKQKCIVSCSGIIPLKRIDLIINTLFEINEINIKWIHFGSGVQQDSIIKLANEKLTQKENIEYEFKGSVGNREIHKFYSKKWIDLFLNVSLFEGIPVSIMEAMSYGIPVIATDVGGTKEIVSNNVGKLVERDIHPKELAHVIQRLLSNSELCMEYSKNAFLKWDNEFNADKNFKKFIELIK